MKYFIGMVIIIILYFGLLYGNFSKQPQPTVVKIEVESEYAESWQGSGVFIDDDLILTAGHIVKDANEIWVIWSNGKKHKAVNWYKESKVDLGIIYIRTLEKEPAAKFDSAVVGETVRAIGSPFEYFPYMTEGIISAVNVEDLFFGKEKLLMTDCPLNPGNSGCPLLNKNNEIVGIAVGSILFADGINFCIPAKICQMVITNYFESLKKVE